MSDHSSPIPQPVLIAAGAMLALTLALVALSRTTGVGQLADPGGEPVRAIDLRFQDDADGGVTVLRASDGHPITHLPRGSNGFIRGVLRSLTRIRRLDRVADDPPFRLTLWSDTRLTLSDPATAQSIDLTGFGKDNRAAFARLLARNSTLAEGR